MQVCLSDQADRDLEIFDGALDEALDFMCYKGGERIASNYSFYDEIKENRHPNFVF